MSSLNQGLLRNQIAAIRRKHPGAGVIAMKSRSRWDGPSSLRVDDQDFRIAQCDSELAIREALLDAGDESIPVVIITDLQEPELGSDPRFATNVARVNNRPETDALVAAGFALRTAADAIAALLKADVALATVNDMDGLSHHPHLRRISVETPNGPVSYPAPAPVFSDHERAYGPVPGLPGN